MFIRIILLIPGLLLTGSLSAQALTVSPLFSEGAVLQRGKNLPIWGTAEPGAPVSLDLDGTTASTEADADGRWQITLPPQEAGGPFTLRIAANGDELTHSVWIGEVWLASGQSNMQWRIGQSRNADFFRATERHETIRLLKIAERGSDQPHTTFRGQWKGVDADTLNAHSAVGFHFAKALQSVLGVPVGIVDNAWGGSPADGWIEREALRAHPELYVIDEAWIRYETAHAHLDPLPDLFAGNSRPGNIYNTRVHPIVTMALRGIIWYQGEGNAGRAHQYRTLFPAMIENWRERWGEELPFYWVQLAAFRAKGPSGPDHPWAELREAQTEAQRLPQTGQAVIIDIGDGDDIHPWEKEEVARRLARWALAKEYGVEDLHYRSPTIRSWEQSGNEVRIQINDTGSGLRTVDLRGVHGFAVAGEDRVWMEVNGRLEERERIVLEIPEGLTVAALRYAWAANPAVNVFTREGLPLTPFRSDDWPLVGGDALVPAFLLDF